VYWDHNSPQHSSELLVHTRTVAAILTMNFFLVSLQTFLFSAVLTLVGAANVRRSQSNNVGSSFESAYSQQRQLQGDGMRDFLPLTCNANLASVACSKWSLVFGTSVSQAARITIPCGQCVTMDHVGNLELLGGLDVIGKLVFPDGYNVNLTSTMIVVQGELQMTSSKPVDGVPAIRFTMIGNDNSLTFTPVDVNANACKGVSTCSIGKKAIIVAGGKVTGTPSMVSASKFRSFESQFLTVHTIVANAVRGLPTDTPTWTRLYNATGGTFNNPTMLLVSNTVQGKWAPGAQVLITSHTRLWNEQQERTIVQVAPAAVSGYVALTLNAPILRPTTLMESPDFAVEVALLSRNFVFEGASDDIATHGGHFMVMHTPSVIQTIEGIELRNFGQQGLLGRYPIHFHFCSDVSESIVSKNTIRQSNQRCVVVHGTNKLLIEENVAFDTKGHCYMTEDGMETGNEFIRNLGAQIDAPATIIPNNGFNGNETDGTPATFWITNPTNTWLGNVAAGSLDSGYWFEPKLRGVRAYLFPNYNPQVEPLGLFKDNVAHSCSGRLVRVAAD
jgi:G8 domain